MNEYRDLTLTRQQIQDTSSRFGRPDTSAEPWVYQPLCDPRDGNNGTDAAFINNPSPPPSLLPNGTGAAPPGCALKHTNRLYDTLPCDLVEKILAIHLDDFVRRMAAVHRSIRCIKHSYKTVIDTVTTETARFIFTGHVVERLTLIHYDRGGHRCTRIVPHVVTYHAVIATLADDDVNNGGDIVVNHTAADPCDDQDWWCTDSIPITERRLTPRALCGHANAPRAELLEMCARNGIVGHAVKRRSRSQLVQLLMAV